MENPKQIKDFKTKLLSSGLPLEFQVARILVSNGFDITPDFKYSRSNYSVSQSHEDKYAEKDFSVDIDADFSPFNVKRPGYNERLNLLVECKYRHPGVSWLFFQDPNKPDETSLRHFVLRFFDKFSPYELDIKHIKHIFDFEEKIKSVYKGVDVCMCQGHNEEATDNQILRGLSQLQYALPRLITIMLSDEMDSQILWHKSIEEDVKEIAPFFICPILVTNAEIFVAKKRVSIKDINSSNKLEDIATKVPYVDVFYGYGPEFENHCKKEFEPLRNILNNKKFVTLNNMFVNAKGYEGLGWTPHNFLKALIEAKENPLRIFFTKFIVCSENKLPKLICEIKKEVNFCYKTMKRRF